MNRRRVRPRRSAANLSRIGAMISYPAMCRAARWRAGPGKEIGLLLAVAVVLATVVGGTVTSAKARNLARVAGAAPTVKISDTLVGPLLVNQSGRTVYMFVRDKRRKDECRTIKGCEQDWPAVTTVSKPVAGPGVKSSRLGTIPYKGNLREVTYNGYPLHTYRFDTGKGSVINIGNVQFGGAWYALNAKGKVVK
jgi:predicted lipoprotein with Yx(FWY)xxD motif